MADQTACGPLTLGADFPHRSGHSGRHHMLDLRPFAPLLARLFLASVFLPAGISYLSDVPGFTAYMTAGGLPAFLAWPAILFEITLGIAMLIGFQARPMAFLGAGFCMTTALLYHLHPGDTLEMMLFYKDLGIAAGFLMIFAHGAGKFALDRA